MAAASIVLIVVPDREFRRSLEFALEVEGFSVASHASLADAMASPAAADAVCAVVDEGAFRIDPASRRTLDRLAKPVILLADGFSAAGDDPQTVLTKPLQGSALIELIQALSEPAAKP
ncbi:transcriptional regulator [Mesorhizobium sp.]|uniref:transcriptional regulator n=1 Tax=Mesorhizobium sp. TaxID=1871066 RepID=UPI000FE9847D|nr:transcriptional regulator [Mesorhizobium sp.]RWB26186.1 MAG: transcriptional regulator [Mesorhizobium sp.]